MTEGRTKIKVTLAGTLVYYFDAWVGSLSGQETILDGTLYLPDEVRIHLAGQRQLFIANSRWLELGQDTASPVADSFEVPIYSHMRPSKVVDRAGRTVGANTCQGTGPTQVLRITNLSDQPLTLLHDTWIGIRPHDADQVCIYDRGDLFALDVERQMVVLPEVVTTTEEVAIDTIQVGTPS
ncbi:Hypothetical protein PHPALM_11370 [Phytophthora palmivora]|uniref:Uncharacterized protein n=1 Tax=Phytophthora palmivora TaxID=4796 RepID=A0A2P4Y2G2_9STRA|nr:Hypothetical protein PHPALM_11370 [Phytophthora palmivora]